MLTDDLSVVQIGEVSELDSQDCTADFHRYGRCSFSLDSKTRKLLNVLAKTQWKISFFQKGS